MQVEKKAAGKSRLMMILTTTKKGEMVDFKFSVHRLDALIGSLHELYSSKLVIM